jgi:hypothetical protein
MLFVLFNLFRETHNKASKTEYSNRRDWIKVESRRSLGSPKQFDRSF